MSRSTSELVGKIIEVDTKIDVDPFIVAASSLVDQVEAATTFSEEKLQLIETWLSAHFYCMRDPRAVSEKAGPVGQTYQSKVDLNLATSHYGQMAMVLDTSGTLRALSRGRVNVSVKWLGTPIG